jgi:hypothetical protein
MQQGNMPEDLDNSGIIDWTDIELFTQYYLTNRIEDGWITDSLTSPCIDAGDPNSDWTAEPMAKRQTNKHGFLWRIDSGK